MKKSNNNSVKTMNNTSSFSHKNDVRSASSETRKNVGKSKKSYSVNIFDLIKKNQKLPKPIFYWGPIQPGSFGFIFGPAKSGKTIFCENLGMSLAARKESFFGESIKKGIDYRVLFISIEEHWRNRTYRNTKQIEKFGFKESDLVDYHAIGDDFPRSFDNVGEFIETIRPDIEALKPNVVFIDSLTRLVGSDYSKAEIGRKVILPFREFADKNNLALVMIHHSVKEEIKQRNAPLSFYSMAGSRVFLQEADYIIGIRKTESGTRYVKEIASRYSKEKEAVTTFKITDSLCAEMLEKTSEHKVLKNNSPDVEILDAKERVKESIKKRWDSGEDKVKRSSIVGDMKEYAGKSRVYDIINELIKEGFARESKKELVKPEAENSDITIDKL